MTRRLAVVAHFDVRGDVAPHVIRQLRMISNSFDHVIVASTSALSQAARETLAAHAQLIERPNVGQDFASWHEALELSDFGSNFDEVLLTNDSYVSVIEDLEPVLSTMRDRPVEAWGLTKTWRHGEHIQSYFVHATRPVVTSNTWRDFWENFQPAANRTAAIMSQEIGLSARLRRAGFRLGSYFEPTTSERRLANRRGVHWLIRRRRAFPEHFPGFGDHFRVRHWRDPEEANNLNWATDFADFVFDDARLPVVKFDTLRYDPHWLDSERLLAECEKRYPSAFEGVRQYITATAHAYAGRPYENSESARLNTLQRWLYGYRPRSSRKRVRRLTGR